MNYSATIKKLLRGIEHEGSHILVINTEQFYSEREKRTINVYVIKRVIISEGHRNKYDELCRTTAQLYVILFLRNFLFWVQNKEIPKTEFPKFEVMWSDFRCDYVAANKLKNKNSL